MGEMENAKTMITDSEWKLMELLWENEPMTIMQMTKCLQESTGWTKHTIISFLKRMEEKDAVFYEDTGKAKQYYTLIPREDAVRELIREFTKKAANGNAGLAIQMFIETSELSGEEIRILQTLLTKKSGAEKNGKTDTDSGEGLEYL